MFVDVMSIAASEGLVASIFLKVSFCFTRIVGGSSCG